MMRILAPEWLLFVPVVVFLAWKAPGRRVTRPLRAAILALLTLVLLHPEIRRHGSGLDVWVLVDRSASAEAAVGGSLAEWETLLRRSRPSGDRLRFVDYAGAVRVRDSGLNEPFSAADGQTRTALAIRHVLAEAAPERPTRLLALTDGYSTEPLDDLAERLRRRRISLDYRLGEVDDAADASVGPLGMPMQVEAGEAFLVEVPIRSAVERDARYTVYRDGELAGTGRVRIVGGKTRVRFSDRVTEPAAVHYRVTLSAEGDSYLRNNWAEHWIEVRGGARVLLVTGDADDPVARVLRDQRMEVDLALDAAGLHAGRLSGASAVILHNVPAYRLPADFLRALPFYVRGQGGGLWMIGGEFSFGSGGYFESPVDPLLPVSMELKEEHRKLAVALAIVMDRSGSMSAVVDGSPGVTKMDLANRAAARTIELLGSADQVAVFAVDSQAHAVVPLSPVRDRREPLIDGVRRIQSGGGGIYIYTGLSAAWEALRTAETGRRHVILYADAADAEEPGAYAALVEDMAAGGASISVIGLGSETDADAELLRDIARRGGGRIFFSDDPRELPALFAQEVVAVARSAFVKEPVAVVDAGGWPELTVRPLDWPASVDGYNLSYLRPEATAGAVSGDRFGAPMTAWWQRGLGRTAAVSFPLGGNYSETVRGWAGYGDFVRTMVRWTLRDETPPGIGVLTSMEGDTLRVELRGDADWMERMARRPPELWIERLGAGTVEAAVWERMSPGRYRARVVMDSRQAVRGVVQIGDTALPFGPVTSGVDAEWSFRPERRAELRRLADLSGGQERINLAAVWDAPRPSAYQDARPALYVVLLALVVVEALVSRIGWSLPVTGGRHRSRAPVAPDAPAVPAGARDESRPASPDQRRNRFARAKRRR